jgi:hypothetical protein
MNLAVEQCSRDSVQFNGDQCTQAASYHTRKHEFNLIVIHERRTKAKIENELETKKKETFPCDRRRPQ